jgi:NAD(P)-dependent dehydrogenase (short-subunit alcohol dehydrogenase family)
VTKLQGKEFFLADHVVETHRLFPGVAYLEMARAAIAQASGAGIGASQGIALHDVVWLRPLVVDEAREVAIELALEDSGEIAFAIASRNGAEQTQGSPATESANAIHSQGRAVLTEASAQPQRDIAALLASCPAEATGSECYAVFAEFGFAYGPSFQALKQVHIGDQRVVARLELPDVTDQSSYILHPSLMDAALQACLGLNLRNKDALEKALPFAVEAVEIYATTPSKGWAIVDPASGATSTRVRKLDIDICDDDGTVCVRLRGFSARTTDNAEGGAPASTFLADIPQVESPAFIKEPARVGTVLLAPVWEPVPAERVAAWQDIWPKLQETVLVLGGTASRRAAIQAHYPSAVCLDLTEDAAVEAIAALLRPNGREIAHLIWLAPEEAHKDEALLDDAVVVGQRRGVLQIFRIIKALIAQGYSGEGLGLTFITEQSQPLDQRDPVNPTHASVHGLVGSLAKEYPHWRVRLLDLPAGQDWPLSHAASASLWHIPANPRGDAFVYRHGQWHQQQLLVSDMPARGLDLYRQGGVYVVIGGAGGIGEVWSEALIRRSQAQIVWIGRRAEDATITAKRERLAAFGPTPFYIAADAGNRRSLEEAYAEIKRRYGAVHGIIHSAIVLLDKSLARMDEATFVAAVAAKVDVSLRLAQVFGREPLDFALFFSSMQSFAKAAGQSNYAAGCTFKDAFALRLGQIWSCPVKVMNWGYWGSVGIVASPEHQARMARFGVGSIEADEGMTALDALLGHDLPQIAFTKVTKPLEASDGVAADWLRVSKPQASSLIDELPDVAASRADVVLAAQQEWFVAEALLSQMTFLRLCEMGLPQRGDWAAIKTTLGLQDRFDRWLDECLADFVTRGLLALEGGIYSRVAEAVPETTLADWAACREKASRAIATHIRLTDACLRALPEILQGRKRATDVLFPQASLSLVEGIYKGNPVADYFNDAMAASVVAYVEARLHQDPSAKIRILEIGSGTGGTSAIVLLPVAALCGAYPRILLHRPVACLPDPWRDRLWANRALSEDADR